MSEVQPTVQYRDIPGFPGYRVGDDGSAWSAWERTYIPGVRGGFRKIGTNWHRLRTYPNDRRYPLVVLFANGRKMKFLHRLVLLSFVGPAPTGMEACHNDGNPANARLDNLRWDTKKANQADRKKHGTDKHGEDINTNKLTAEQVHEIRACHVKGKFSPTNGARLAEKYNVSVSSISLIVRGRNWKRLLPT